MMMTTAMTMTILLWSARDLHSEKMHLDAHSFFFFYSDILSFILFVLALQMNEHVFLCVHLCTVCVYVVSNLNNNIR